MLCRDCEQLFAGWEQVVYEKLFLPLHDSKPVKADLPYGPWALQFAVSVSFRVLSFYMRLGLSDWPLEQQNSAARAILFWRKFLLAAAPHPAEFEQHLLPVDVIESHTTPGLSPFMNRYLLRAFQMDVLSGRESAFVYTKLGRILLFGHIHEPKPHEWKGTKLHVRKGSIHPRHYSVPGAVLRYLNDQADLIGRAMTSISPNQNQKIAEAIMKKPAQAASSEVFRAMHYDLVHSGQAAFSGTQGSGESGEG